MGQQEVLKFFKENPQIYFSVDELASALNINKQTAYSLLRKLKDTNDLDYREIISKGNYIKQMFCYKIKDDYFEEALHDYNYLRTKDKYATTNSDILLNLLLLRELKILNKRVEHLEELNGKQS